MKSHLAVAGSNRTLCGLPTEHDGGGSLDADLSCWVCRHVAKHRTKKGDGDVTVRVVRATRKLRP